MILCQKGSFFTSGNFIFLLRPVFIIMKNTVKILNTSTSTTVFYIFPRPISSNSLIFHEKTCIKSVKMHLIFFAKSVSKMTIRRRSVARGDFPGMLGAREMAHDSKSLSREAVWSSQKFCAECGLSAAFGKGSRLALSQRCITPHTPRIDCLKLVFVMPKK